MIVSCAKPNQVPQDISSRRRISRTRRCPTHQLRAGPTKVASEKGSGSRRNAATGSGRNGFRIRMRTVARTHFAHHLLTARTHGGVTQCTHMRGVEPAGWRTNLHPLVGASALHGVSGFSSGSHLGSTLRPGRAVLTRGVSRRSGSVACIRADASPTEVLASPSWHQKRCRSNIIEKYLTSAQHRRGSERTPAGVHRGWTAMGATPLLVAAT